MEEWVKKLIASFGRVPFEARPLEEVGPKQLIEALGSVHLNMMAAPDNSWVKQRDIPPIYVYKDYGRIHSPFYLPVEEMGVKPGVYIGESLLKKLNTPQNLAIILHEYGHHYGRHYERQKVLERTEGNNIVTVNAARSRECESDHFMSYYFPKTFAHNASHYLGEMMKIVRGGGVETSVSADSVHASDIRRIYESGKSEWQELEPGRIRFNRQCQVLETYPAPIALPRGSVEKTEQQRQ